MSQFFWALVAMSALLVAIGFPAWLSNRPKPKLWSFAEVMQTSCSGGTVYEKHSLIKLYVRRLPLFRKSYIWKCHRCDIEWRTSRENFTPQFEPVGDVEIIGEVDGKPLYRHPGRREM